MAANEELNARNINSLVEEMKKFRMKLEDLEKKYMALNNSLGNVLSETSRLTQEINMMKARSYGTGSTVKS